ncbi:hypothetical protein C2E25_03795 [Geothermobacter hydrogeniphilus]|uniref:FlgN protein n=1 Tax=Geothermobacter hydrogeniphilus TaxID=1969733 RepID=A0A2K2HCZ2_9BACT|nr:hypothetical protein [Geothermobacter hydrogeniphilus]PNU21168.1 hypothetical protein C2E25_03795 [Geothermobacter hydrogeniphilus]
MNTADEIAALLTTCNARYLSMARFMETLLEEITGNRPLVIREKLKELEAFQAEAARLDTRMKQRVEESGISVLPQGLIAQRRELLNRIGECNRLLVDKLEGKMSVMADELERNRRGRSALGKYKSAGRKGTTFHYTT